MANWSKFLAFALLVGTAGTPAHAAWHEAKYNYELALRLSPLFELKHSKQEPDESDDAETVDGWASIPGFPRGMP